MIKSVVDMFSDYEVVNVTVSDDYIGCNFLMDVEDVDLEGNSLTFGNADQEICISQIDRYEISEGYDSFLLNDKEQNRQIELYFIR